MKRRDLLKWLGTSLMAFSAGSVARVFAQSMTTAASPAAVLGSAPDVVWVENGEPAALLQAALREIGGFERFITKGDKVLVKPNIGWDRTPEQAATTNPDLVGEIVKECLKAGASSVRVFDRTCNNPQRCYGSSGIQEKAEAAGAEVVHLDDSHFRDVALKNGKTVTSWPIYIDYLDASKVINVPIAKHHGLARVTLGLKNLMGVMGGKRGELHTPFEEKLVDVCSAILPTLTIIDAYRMLLNHGPQGGKPEDVKLARALIMSPCTVAADHAALQLFGLKPADVPYLKAAADRGLAKIDLTKMNLKKVSLS